MNDFNSTVSIERVKELLSYDPETGVFTWKIDRCHKARKGAAAGSLSESGYLEIRIGKRNFRAHRMAWAVVQGAWPTMQIDHINGVRNDNRIANLRLATRSQNAQNLRKAMSNSSHGFLGVKKNGNRWNASINLEGEYIYLGCFKTPEIAHSAYLKAKRDIHEFCTI